MTTLTLATAPLLPAAGTYGGWQHAGPPFAPLFLLVPLFWLLVAGAVFFALSRRRRFAGAPWRHVDEERIAAPRGTRGAERILAERFARGDVDEAEYRLRLEVLRGTDDGR